MSALAAYALPLGGGLDQQGSQPGQMGEVVPFPSQEPQEPTDLQRIVVNLQRLSEMDNATDILDVPELDKLGDLVAREYDIDEKSRAEWRDMAERAMGAAELKIESKSTPWPDASNVKYPLLTTASLQFAARAYPAIVDGPVIVKGKVLGADPKGAKAAMADRVSQYMSYQFLYELPEWEEDVDTLLHQIPIIGCAFRKIYPDPLSDSGFRDDLVSAFDFVVNQKTKRLATVPRATFVLTFYPHECRERMRAGTWREVDLQLENADGDSDEDAPHEFLEQHRYYDVDGDGYAEPWIVTVHKTTRKVVRLRANFDLEGMKVDQRKGRIIKIPRGNYCTVVKIPFLRDPKGGFYDIGFGKLLAGISDTIDTAINQMMDAGTLQNSGGGFLGGAVQLNKSKIRFRPGEYQTVASSGDDIRKSVVNMEHPGPAPVLFQLLELMVNAGKDVASVKDILTGETPTNQTATSTMAAIEQGLKVFTAIYKRVYRALGHEFKAVYEINRRYLDPQKYLAYFDPTDPQSAQMLMADFHDKLDVLPVADPNTVTDMQRMAKAQFLKEMMAEGMPINPIIVTQRALEAARIEKPDELLPDPNAPKPPSPDEIKTKAMADQAQIKNEAAQQAAQLQLQTKMAEAQMKMEQMAADLHAKMQQMELARQSEALKYEARIRQLELDARAMQQKAIEGDIAHEHAKRSLDLKAEAAE